MPKIMDAKANARAAAIRRTGGSKVQKRPSGNQKGAETFSFLSGSSQGFEMSPKGVLIFSLIFIGVVVVLHILGKIRGASTVE